MKLTIAAPRSLAAAPLLLLSQEKPGLCSVSFFTDHDEALAELAAGEIDILCSGYSECDRVTTALKPRRALTFVWGLSALMVRDAGTKNLDDLSQALTAVAGAALLLPFAGSPLDLQVRALLGRLFRGQNLPLTNAPLPQTMQGFMHEQVFAAVMPEPMATLLESSGKAHRLCDVADLHERVTGGRCSPQVSLFLREDKRLSEEFLSAFEQAIQLMPALNPGQCAQIAGKLDIPLAVFAHALPHVLFGLPAEKEVHRRETIYAELLLTGHTST